MTDRDQHDDADDPPPARPRRRSGFWGVVGGMFWGVVLIGGTLVILNQTVFEPVDPPAGSGSETAATDGGTPGAERPPADNGTDASDTPAKTGGTATSETPAPTDTPATDTPATETPATKPPAELPATDDQAAASPPAATGPEVPPIALSGPAIEVNARDFTLPDEAALLSVVLYGGTDEPQTAEALGNISMPLTLAMAAGRPGVDAAARDAVARGFEVLAELPMAPGGTGNVGMTVRHTAAALEARSAGALAELNMAVGAVAPDGATMLSDPDAMAAVLKPITAHTFVWVEPRASSRSAAARLAVETDLTFLQANVFVAPDASGDDVFAGLEEAAGKARALGTAIVFIEAGPEGLRALVRWGFEKAASGVVLAPISAIVRKRGKG